MYKLNDLLGVVNEKRCKKWIKWIKLLKDNDILYIGTKDTANDECKSIVSITATSKSKTLIPFGI